MAQNYIYFIILVAAAVFILSIALTTPAFGESTKNRSRLRKRLRDIRMESNLPDSAQLLRGDHHRRLSPWERELEESPLTAYLSPLIRQAGYTIPAYRLAAIIILSGFIGLLIGYWMSNIWWTAILIAVACSAIPVIKLLKDRNKRMENFEESLPDALDIMKRALQAGHPFSSTLHLVGEEMEGPVAEEFAITFADLNYGNSLRNSLLGLLERMPSVTVMALVTSIIIQKETGGNMAEIFEKLASLIRGRYRFQRRVRTLSAEGRISAWVLCMVPFVLFLFISITTPSYMPILFEHPLGQKLLVGGGIAMLIGILVIRKIIRIEV